MRARLLVVPALALVSAAALAPAHATATRTVSAKDSVFAPQVARVRVGDVVVWTNTGSLPHEVTASDGSFSSGNIAPGASYRRTFSAAGDVRYYCRYHGTTASGMTGAVRVVAAGVDLPGLPNTGGGREVATGVAVIALTLVVGAGLHVATREGITR